VSQFYYVSYDVARLRKQAFVATEVEVTGMAIFGCLMYGEWTAHL